MLEGLFGHVIPNVFEILPYLHARQLFPDWEIRAAFYGTAPHGAVIPGVVDLAYKVAPGPKKDVDFRKIQNRHRHVLGNDWPALSAIWNDYFRIPDRIIRNARSVGSLSDALGIHYRGNDKNTALWDTNPVSHDDFLAIIRDFLIRRPEFRRIFLATDDFSFVELLTRKLSVEIINLGEVVLHKAETSLDVKTDRAMLDCVLLSRCRAVLLTSSALSAFAKIFSPELEIYRVAASKRFADVPYFPVAYVPRYETSSPQIAALVDRLMAGDWSEGADAHLFTAPFAARPRWSAAVNLIRLLYSYVRWVERWPGFQWITGLREMGSNPGRRRKE
jgi:hypothetical protein